MKILAIETSCDDTGIAILEVKGLFKPHFNVLSNIVSSQSIHQNYGGVFPMMAKREHQKNLVPVFTKALQEAKLLEIAKSTLSDNQLNTLKELFKKEDELFTHAKELFENYKKPNVSAIAVTYGPGLEPCLWVGVNFARAISCIWGIPLIPVNHIEAHILVNFLAQPKINFPAISLVVSGGHTQLISMKGIGKYEIIGETRDDAAGECFDKCAKLLGLGYPGGPIISKIASENQKTTITLPRPMIHSKDYDFSFSGLKTAVLYETKGKELTKDYVGQMSVSVQEAIIDVLVKKTLQASESCKAKTIILGGGVSANAALRAAFAKNAGVPVMFPEPKLSTDNALMIAIAGYFNRTKKIAGQNLSAHANLRIGS